MLVAAAVGWDGRHSVLGVELANRESRPSWRDFLLGLKGRGLPFAGFCPRPLRGPDRASADARWGRVRGHRRPAGAAGAGSIRAAAGVSRCPRARLRAALREVLAEAAYQGCYVHFPRNALDHVPRPSASPTSRRGPQPITDRSGVGRRGIGRSPMVDDDCLQELRWLDDRRDLATWLTRWQGKCPKLTSWVEEHIEETLTFYRLPRQHHKHMKSTNMLERLNEEIKRRAHIARILPNTDSCLRLVRALAVETHESWLEQHRYLNMEDLREHQKEQLRLAA